jgi:rubredoxin
MSKIIPFDPVKRKASKDICPKCGGELDTGWECNDCGFDAYALVHGHPFNGAVGTGKEP